MGKKKKILALCDHALSFSGVGTQAYHLFQGLLDTGEYQIRSFGAAVKHADYTTVSVPPLKANSKWSEGDFIIKPIDGFGNPDMLRQALVTERPDVLFLFTDPRFFLWVWEMEEEVHQICPIVYWHVWDNEPWPEYNRVLYDSTDLINCHSHLTYSMVNKRYPEKCNFVPHALPNEIFNPLSAEKIKDAKQQILTRDRVDHFVAIWVNRNAKRKRGNDVLESWKLFLDKLEAKHGHRKATLIMHTDPFDNQGSNLINVAEMLGIQNSVFYSKERVGFEQMELLYNISDCCINISLNEGFGLSTLEAMKCGTPIVALTTGGLTRQVIDHRDNSENGVALPVELRSLVGSQVVPYIYEDYVSNETTSNGLLKLFDMGADERKKLGLKAREYVNSEFNIDKTVSEWHRTMCDIIYRWNNDRNSVYEPWEIVTL